MKYLALGDSYTIGELVDENNNFPNQLTRVLISKGYAFLPPKIIAVTGWTTDELAVAIEKEKPQAEYDLVTLLVGVNNQYRARSEEEYRWQFYALLCQATLFAQGKPEKVIVLSIPDWGLTPFNKDRDKKQTSAEIDILNSINKQLSKNMGCKYVDVTTSSREHAEDPFYLSSDLLHYSEAEYKLWVDKIMAVVEL